MFSNRIFLSFYCYLSWNYLTFAQRQIACVGVADGTFVSSSESCQSYYYCLDGVAHANNCPDKLLFNGKSQVCDQLENVDCGSCSPFGVQHLAHEYDCSQYYKCVLGQRTGMVCSEELMFDKSIGDCNVPSAVACDSLSTICRQFASIAFIDVGDPNDCNRFFSCVNGKAFHRTCAENLNFNPYTGKCEIPSGQDTCQGNGPLITPPNWDINDSTTKPPATQQPPTQPPQPPPPSHPTQPPPTPQPPPSPEPTIPPTIIPPSSSPTKPPPPPPTETTYTPPETTVPPTQPSASPIPEDDYCPGGNGWFGVAGSCIDMIYCVDYEIRIRSKCLPSYYYDVTLKYCTSVRPPGCTEWTYDK